jgi:hypothetical protein
MKLGLKDTKVTAPKNPQELCNFLSNLMAATINYDVDVDNVKIALNAATRLVEVMQADTRMKVAAHMTGSIVSDKKGWNSLETIEASQIN